MPLGSELYLMSLQPVLAVKPLKKALLRSNPAHFSFMHTLFTRLCLQAKCYRDAMPVLDVDVFDFPASKGAKDVDLNGKGFEVMYRDVMEFYLFGALLYMGVKKWRRAMDYLCYVSALEYPTPTLANVVRSSHFQAMHVLSSKWRLIRSSSWLGCY